MAQAQSKKAAESIAHLRPVRKFSLDKESRARGETVQVDLSTLAHSIIADVDNRAAQSAAMSAAVVKVQGQWRQAQTRKHDPLTAAQATARAQSATLESLGMSTRGSGGIAGQVLATFPEEEQDVIRRYQTAVDKARKDAKAGASS